MAKANLYFYYAMSHLCNTSGLGCSVSSVMPYTFTIRPLEQVTSSLHHSQRNDFIMYMVLLLIPKGGRYSSSQKLCAGGAKSFVLSSSLYKHMSHLCFPRYHHFKRVSCKHKINVAGVMMMKKNQEGFSRC